MSDLKKALEITGAKNEAELVQYLETQKSNIDQLKTGLEKIKKECTAAKTKATKAEKKLKEAEELNSSLQTELENQGAEIAELKEKANQSKKNLPSLAELKNKALKIIKQEGVSTVYVSLQNQVFLSESKCKNAVGSKYKVATLVDANTVQLSSPS